MSGQISFKRTLDLSFFFALIAPWQSQDPLRIAEGSDYWQLIHYTTLHYPKLATSKKD